jgi:hypothetical protein
MMGFLVAVCMWAEKPGAVRGMMVEERSGEPVRKAVVILDREQGESVGTESDSKGAFALRELVPGGYIVRVERDGYMLAPGGRPRVVTVTAGETTHGIRLKLVRTAAISGRIIDTDGDPIVGANVRIVPVPARRKRGEAYATTNDRGEYRAFQVAPGSYSVAVTYSPRVQQMPIRMQSKAGAYPTMYYPGTLEVRQATVLTVGAGEDLHGIDIQLIRASGVRIRGRVVIPAGVPSVFVIVSLEPGEQRELVRDPKGEFELSDVLPGTYRMIVAAGGSDEASRLTATRRLEVGDVDIEGLEIALGPPQKVKGRIIAPEARKLPTGLMIILGTSDSNAGGIAQVGADGTFVTTAVPPGDYDVMVRAAAGPGDDLYLSAIRQGDEDALTEGVHIADEVSAPLVIVLKANGATAECTVKDAEDAAVYGAHVLLVPDGPVRSRALSGSCRTDEHGICRIVGITPGVYHAYALAAETEIDLRNLDAMRPLEKFGRAINLAEGERRALDLRPVPE